MDFVELDGVKYHGRFEGDLVEGGRQTFSSSEAPDAGYTAQTYYYEGFGKIERRTGFPDGGEYLFRFRTKSSRSDGRLASHIRDLAGGSFSYMNLDEATGREAFMHCIYEHLKKNVRSSATITPPLLDCRSISSTEVGNARARLSEAFSY